MILLKITQNPVRIGKKKKKEVVINSDILLWGPRFILIYSAASGPRRGTIKEIRIPPKLTYKLKS